MDGLFAGTLACTLVLAVYGFYSSSDDVVELNPINFYPLVIQSDSLWLVGFYVPQCEYCQEHAAAWKRVAVSLKGLVEVGAVDADLYNSLSSQYGIREFPTFKIFGANKNKPEDYKGNHSSQAIIDWAINAWSFPVKEQMDEKTGGFDKGRQRRSTGDEGSMNDVALLRYDNFKKTVLDSECIWLVGFFANWCEHCRSLVPKWVDAATKVKLLTWGNVRLGTVNIDRYMLLAHIYKITEVPTIMIFQKDKDVAEYNGAKTTSAIVDYALNLFNTFNTSKLLERQSSGDEGSMDDVVLLRYDNFKNTVLESEGIWLVGFFADWCEHSRSLVPKWVDAATKVKLLTWGNVRLGTVNIDRYMLLAHIYKVTAVPTIMIFQKGKAVGEYNGARTTSAIVAFAKNLFSIPVVPSKLLESEDSGDGRSLKGVVEQRHLQ